MSFVEMFSKRLDEQEKQAWNEVKERMKTSNPILDGLIELAFKTGFATGSAYGQEDMKFISKLDPVGFYEWLSDKSIKQ